MDFLLIVCAVLSLVGFGFAAVWFVRPETMASPAMRRRGLSPLQSAAIKGWAVLLAGLSAALVVAAGLRM